MRPATATTIDYAAYWERAWPWPVYLAKRVRTHMPLWQGIYRTAVPPADAVAAAQTLGNAWRLLVLSEDWCGDAANSLPVLARFAEAVGWPLRVLARDEVPELMDRHLTNGARSIPIVLLLDEVFRLRGRWGPRPAELQAWVQAQRADGRSIAELYPRIRAWYARDRGHSVVGEVLAVALQAAEDTRRNAQ
jgi:hypothetical protein